MRLSPDGFTLLLGGARSGKSDLAVRLGRAWEGEVVIAATATAGDDDMANRIERHRFDRPPDWGLLEASRLGAGDIVAVDDDALLLVDCITMLVANLLFADFSDTDIDAHITMLADTIAARSGPSIVVSNEVGLGIHPPSELGRTYRDALGRSNRRLADRADTSLLIVAGKALPLDDVEASW